MRVSNDEPPPARIRRGSPIPAAYRRPELQLWDLVGRRTIERLDLPPGARVLDVGCGAGASALAAARAVGKRGKVIGVDNVNVLLERAMHRAAEQSITNVRWYYGDVLTLPFKPGTFDAVVSVFGAATDLPEAIRALSALVRQGGTLALTTSDADELPPASDAFWRAVLQVRPAIVETSRTWFVGHTPESMARLLLESDIADADIAHETHHVELATPEDTWRLLEGCGYSRVLARLSVLERDLVEMLTLRPLLEQQVRTVNVGIVYAIART